MDPVTVVQAAAAVASLGKTLGGGGKPPSVHQGWRVQGVLSARGLDGTTTAWDQKGNTWGSAFEQGPQAGELFRSVLGDSQAQVPVDVTIPATADFWQSFAGQVRAGLQRIAQTQPTAAPQLPRYDPAVDPYANPWTGPAPRAGMTTQPVNVMTPPPITPPIKTSAPGQKVTTAAGAQINQATPPAGSDWPTLAVLGGAALAVLSLLA